MELSRAILLDDLTMLPNRRALNKHLESLTQSHRSTNTPFFLLFIDVDDFKKINDTYDHETGDRLLYQVAHRISRNTQFVARLAGDEFIVTVTNSTFDDLYELVNRLIEELAQPFKILDDFIIHISISIGISRFPFDGTDLASLINHADLAMYDAKRNGKNKFSFYTYDSILFNPVVNFIDEKN